MLISIENFYLIIDLIMFLIMTVFSHIQYLPLRNPVLYYLFILHLGITELPYQNAMGCRLERFCKKIGLEVHKQMYSENLVTLNTT